MRHSVVEDDELGMWGLLTRSWIMASVNNFYRLHGMFRKAIPWFQHETVCDGNVFEKCYKPYNTDVLDETAEYARIIVQVLTVFVTIISFLSYKYRSLARALIYLEVTAQVACLFYPNSSRAWANDGRIEIEFISYFVLYYCGSVRSFWFCMAALVFSMYFNSFVAYQYLFNFDKGVSKFVRFVAMFFLMAYMVIGIDNVAKLHK